MEVKFRHLRHNLLFSPLPLSL
ncbi:hypothetical protein CCACVL1_19698 [Corchorus capsularis]|uniref:Uncharacterized protein n=1 Tax=Corchorus capsularis TaxID=210143 RepID=A0A1R3HFD4_COCAP|nr:hypothetical protein CCACVL1_19698 [Corchorus capsularis]